ncbi:hypothetical protein JL720_5259 [Aureococcus anophagefferens]|nr:hypothetical protein JL720_5259 [Aureococcus anophagefferens]
MARELAAITSCPEKQEIVHVHKEGRQNASCARQEAKWRKALAAPQVITHNPVTVAGGCFGTHAADGAGARRLARMLQSSNATVVSWTRRNSLRVVLADMCASNTGDNSGSASACYPWRTADYSPEYVASRTAIEYGKRQKIVSIAADAGGVADFDFETFAARAATLMALLGHIARGGAGAAAPAGRGGAATEDVAATRGPTLAAFLERPVPAGACLAASCRFPELLHRANDKPYQLPTPKANLDRAEGRRHCRLCGAACLDDPVSLGYQPAKRGKLLKRPP